ncbi:MAG TPA: tyrosine-protein phosphatase, partial [Vicinamibacterales bacterium]
MSRTHCLALASVVAVVLAIPQRLDAQLAPGGTSIDNFAKVNDHYFRGAQPEGRDYADLAALGVKTVINLIGDSDLDVTEQSMVEQHGMRYVHIAMSTRIPPTAKQLDTFLSLVNDAATQPVYVHCVGGRHRTGVMTAIYRMTNDGLTGDQAFTEMKQFNYG